MVGWWGEPGREGEKKGTEEEVTSDEEKKKTSEWVRPWWPDFIASRGRGGKVPTVVEELRKSKQLLLTQRLASIRNRLLVPFACSRTDPFSLAR